MCSANWASKLVLADRGPDGTYGQRLDFTKMDGSLKPEPPVAPQLSDEFIRIARAAWDRRNKGI